MLDKVYQVKHFFLTKGPSYIPINNNKLFILKRRPCRTPRMLKKIIGGGGDDGPLARKKKALSEGIQRHLAA